MRGVGIRKLGFRFAKIPAKLFESDLSAHARLAYAALDSHGPRKIFPGHKRLARLMNVSISTVRRALRELQGRGWLVIQQRIGTSNLYELRPTPSTLSKDTFEPASDLPEAGDSSGWPARSIQNDPLEVSRGAVIQINSKENLSESSNEIEGATSRNQEPESREGDNLGNGKSQEEEGAVDIREKEVDLLMKAFSHRFCLQTTFEPYDAEKYRTLVRKLHSHFGFRTLLEIIGAYFDHRADTGQSLTWPGLSGVADAIFSKRFGHLWDRWMDIAESFRVVALSAPDAARDEQYKELSGQIKAEKDAMLREAMIENLAIQVELWSAEVVSSAAERTASVGSEAENDRL